MSVLVDNIIEVPNIEVRDTDTEQLEDPGTFTAVVTAPDGTETTYTEADPEITHPSIGKFTLEFLGHQVGRWFWTITTTDPVASDDGYEDVRPRAADPIAQLTTCYATVQDLRNELDINDDAILSDRKIQKLIIDAEDLIDEDLGARHINDTTGRKVTQTDVDEWRFVKLNRATVKLAALMYRNPRLTEQQFTEVRGPDYWFKGPMGERFGTSVDPLLNQSGLRRLTTTTSRGRRPRWHSFAYNTDSECD